MRRDGREDSDAKKPEKGCKKRLGTWRGKAVVEGGGRYVMRKISCCWSSHRKSVRRFWKRCPEVIGC